MGKTLNNKKLNVKRIIKQKQIKKNQYYENTNEYLSDQDYSDNESTASMSRQRNSSDIQEENRSSYNYKLMRFHNAQRKKTYRIYCFEESSLDIPSKFQKNIIDAKTDNDKQTDDEEIKYAIDLLLDSIKEQIN